VDLRETGRRKGVFEREWEEEKKKGENVRRNLWLNGGGNWMWMCWG
jgi:hypothetical protein